MKSRIPTTFTKASIFLAFSLWAAGAGAQAVAEAACDLRIASGPSGKVYERIVQDIRASCGEQVRVCNVNSTGGLQNLQLLSSNQAELGMVQLDLLQKMKDSDDNIGSLKAVVPLHFNLLHIITLSAGSLVDVKRVPWTNTAIPITGSTEVFTRFSQLRNRTVALVGSGQLTVQILQETLNYNLTMVNAESDEAALTMLKKGDVQAVLTLAGWPMPVVARMGKDSGFALAVFDITPSAPYKVVNRNYQNMNALNLPMLAVPNLLVTRPFKPSGEQGLRVAGLQSCLTQKLESLKEGRFQPAWKEVKDIGDTQGLTRFEGLAPTTARKVAVQ